MEPDSLHQLEQIGRTWADLGLHIWRDIRGEVLAAAGGFVAGWIGLPRPRMGRKTRKEDRKSPLPPARGRRRGLGLFQSEEEPAGPEQSD